MYKNYYLVLLFGHILGDYYFQTDKAAKAKNEKSASLFLHCLIYFITEAVIIIPLFGRAGFSTLFIVGISHFIIDSAKFILIKYIKIYKKTDNRTVYIADQIFHLVFIGTAAYVLLKNRIYISALVFCVLDNMNIDGVSFFKIVFTALLMAKPANTTIKVLMKDYKPEEEERAAEKQQKTGGFIGILERYIIFTLLYMNQYSAVGLVLTAKSIARYPEFKDKNFAEYYLTGTLLSTFFMLAVYLLVF